MAMLCLSISVSAYDFEVDGIAYTITSLTDLTVGVEKLVSTDLTEAHIPENVEYKNKNLKVTSVANNAFKGNEKLNMICLPNTIVYIGSSAFMNCSSLTTINMPESLTYIGANAFENCTSITTFNIPLGVEQINSRTFYGCKSLLNIDIPSNIKSIGAAAFTNSGLQSISIPSSVVSLGESTFAGTEIESIHLPNGIDIIPTACFSRCSKLCQVSFSSSIINSEAFRNCVALRQISLPENLSTIGSKAFAGCENLEKMIIPSGVTSIAPDILWECSKLETLKIGSGLEGFPVFAYHSYGTHQSYEYSTLGSFYSAAQNYYNGPYNTKSDIAYLEAVRNFIIDDSEDAFSIKGFYCNQTCTPPFTNIELDYYYVGRPLIDIQKWNSTTGSVEFTVDIKQGTGRIKKLEIGGSCTTIPYFYQKIDTLKLGSKIKIIHLGKIYKEDIVKIECLSTEPPTITNGDFPTNVYTDALLLVPSGCKDIYAKAEIWKNFWNIQEAEEESGILDITDDRNCDINYQVYNLAGNLILKSDDKAEIHKLPKGIYIIISKAKRYKIIL